MSLDAAANKINHVLLCGGKIYFELSEQREKLKRDDVAILRVEQLYPLRDELLQSALTALPRRHAGVLGPGGAGKHGRMV